MDTQGGNISAAPIAFANDSNNNKADTAALNKMVNDCKLTDANGNICSTKVLLSLGPFSEPNDNYSSNKNNASLSPPSAPIPGSETNQPVTPTNVPTSQFHRKGSKASALSLSSSNSTEENSSSTDYSSSDGVTELNLVTSLLNSPPILLGQQCVEQTEEFTVGSIEQGEEEVLAEIMKGVEPQAGSARTIGGCDVDKVPMRNEQDNGLPSESTSVLGCDDGAGSQDCSSRNNCTDDSLNSLNLNGSNNSGGASHQSLSSVSTKQTTNRFPTDGQGPEETKPDPNTKLKTAPKESLTTTTTKTTASHIADKKSNGHSQQEGTVIGSKESDPDKESGIGPCKECVVVPNSCPPGPSVYHDGFGGGISSFNVVASVQEGGPIDTLASAHNNPSLSPGSNWLTSPSFSQPNDSVSADCFLSGESFEINNKANHNNNNNSNVTNKDKNSKRNKNNNDVFDKTGNSLAAPNGEISYTNNYKNLEAITPTPIVPSPGFLSPTSSLISHTHQSSLDKARSLVDPQNLRKLSNGLDYCKIQSQSPTEKQGESISDNDDDDDGDIFDDDNASDGDNESHASSLEDYTREDILGIEQRAKNAATCATTAARNIAAASASQTRGPRLSVEVPKEDSLEPEILGSSTSCSSDSFSPFESAEMSPNATLVQPEGASDPPSAESTNQRRPPEDVTPTQGNPPSTSMVTAERARLQFDPIINVNKTDKITSPLKQNGHLHSVSLIDYTTQNKLKQQQLLNGTSAQADNQQPGAVNKTISAVAASHKHQRSNPFLLDGPSFDESPSAGPPCSSTTRNNIRATTSMYSALGVQRDMEASLKRQSLSRRHIEKEMFDLDTGMPELDFERLEAQLSVAAKEREDAAKRKYKLLNEFNDDPMPPYYDPVQPYPPAPTTRPLKSNLATRLQSGMNLQICFMNDDSMAGTEEEFLSAVPKSKSTPDLGNAISPPQSSPTAAVSTTIAQSCKLGLGKSVSNCSSGDSTKKASELRKSLQEKLAEADEDDVTTKQIRLEAEARLMLAKAKEVAVMQLEVEKQQAALNARSPIDDVVGFTVTRKELNRSSLTRMNITQLQIIVNDFHSKIQTLNEELVHLLIERDNLHMEQDSMLVDIEDLTQHNRHDELRLPEFLIASQLPEQIKHRFKIFKR